MFKRSLLSSYLSLMLVLSVSVSSTMAQDSPPPTPIAAGVGTGNIHISFWNGLTGSDGSTLVDILAKFAAENPKYSITTEMIPWATLYVKLQASFVAGDPPDVFLVHATELPQYGTLGLVRDMSDQYASGAGWLSKEDLSPITHQHMLWNGVPIGVPLDNHGFGLWINVDMFNKAGISTDPAAAPTDYAGWVELFQKVTLDKNGNNALSPNFDPENVVQWGYTAGESALAEFTAALVQHGGSILSPDSKTVTVNSPEGIQALQMAVDLIYKYHVSPPQAGFNSWDAYSAGQLAVLPTGTWFRNFAAKTTINGRAWPYWQWGPHPATWFGDHTFMVPASLQGDKLTGVLEMIKWVGEHQVDWAASGQVPARLSAQAKLDPVNYPSNIVLGRTFTEYGYQYPETPAWDEMEAALVAELNSALNNLKTPEQALNDAAARMQKALDRAG